MIRKPSLGDGIVSQRTFNLDEETHSKFKKSVKKLNTISRIFPSSSKRLKSKVFMNRIIPIQKKIELESVTTEYYKQNENLDVCHQLFKKIT